MIGAGAGGLAVATAAAAVGQRVVLIEKGKMGGDSLNYGCVPSKALIAAARRAHQMRTADQFGISSVHPAIDPRGVYDHVHARDRPCRPERVGGSSCGTWHTRGEGGRALHRQGDR